MVDRIATHAIRAMDRAPSPAPWIIIFGHGNGTDEADFMSADLASVALCDYPTAQAAWDAIAAIHFTPSRTAFIAAEDAPAYDHHTIMKFGRDIDISPYREFVAIARALPKS